MQILDGKKASQEIKDEVRDAVAKLPTPPALAVVLVGDDPASAVYVANKKKACEYTGIRSESHELPGDTTEEELLALVDRLNADPAVNGILVQFPLPNGIDEEKVLLRIAHQKDVDCFNPFNIGLVQMNQRGERKGFVPCTPAGVMELLKRNGVEIDGKDCVVIGRSNIVGRPMASLLLLENGTVTICHSRTKNLPEICRRADILVAAVGRRWFVTPDMVKEGAVVVDVGMHRDGKKLSGDVDPACAEKASFYTPVPGGVGPMTIAMLMQNCLTAYIQQNSEF